MIAAILGFIAGALACFGVVTWCMFGGDQHHD
jgi:hypothetical protein